MHHQQRHSVFLALLLLAACTTRAVTTLTQADFQTPLVNITGDARIRTSKQCHFCSINQFDLSSLQDGETLFINATLLVSGDLAVLTDMQLVSSQIRVGGTISFGPASRTRVAGDSGVLMFAQGMTGNGGSIVILTDTAPASAPNPVSFPFAQVDSPIVNFFGALLSEISEPGGCRRLGAGLMVQSGADVAIELPVLVVGKCPLSSGAIAGIVVGCIAAVALILIVIAAVLYRNRIHRETAIEKAEAAGK